MVTNLSIVVLPRVHTSHAVQDGCQRLLTRHVIILDVKFNKLQNFKAPEAKNGCADTCNTPPIWFFPRVPPASYPCVPPASLAPSMPNFSCKHI